jgi:hypothetical protein
MIHSTLAVFPEFQSLAVKKKVLKNNIDFLLNKVKLILGEEPTKVIAAEEQKTIATLPSGPNHNLPRTIKAVLKCSEASQWKTAAVYEMDQFANLGVWEPIRPYPGMKVLGARWVFAIKHKPDGTILEYRARYVAKGFNQTMGVDCNEVYAPTASLNTLQLLLLIAQEKSFSTATFDVSSAYLYSPIEEEVYVQPPIEIVPEWRGQVMKLKKAMYGTRQAARCWWKFFKGKMEKLGYVANELEPSLYHCRNEYGFIVIWLHVDNGFAMASSPAMLNSLREAIEGELDIKWSDKVDRLVGINIKKTQDSCLELDQHLLVNQVVREYCRPCYPRRSTLPEEALEVNEGETVDTTAFRSVIGSLMYLAGGTRPDLTYSVNLLARYSNSPSQKNWEALDHLIGYIKRTSDLTLVFSNNGGKLELWSDSNWGGEHERSTSGHIIKHNGNTISWAAKRQTVVALSTCAAEYIALSKGAQVLAQLNNLPIDLDLSKSLEIYCDNEAAILISGDNASKNKTKYLTRAFYFINDFVQHYDVKIKWTATLLQLANIFTKRLGPNKIEESIPKINLKKRVKLPHVGGGVEIGV